MGWSKTRFSKVARQSPADPSAGGAPAPAPGPNPAPTGPPSGSTPAPPGG